jgi:hypothetical protein
MKGEIHTMRKLTTIAALAGVAAILAVPAWGAGSKTGVDTATAPQITVSGTGSVNATPDVAVWTFGLTSRATTARGALAANGTEMRKVIAALKAAGIAAADIRTSQVSLGARTNQDGTAVVGYEASNSVTAKVRNGAGTGEIVDKAIEAGADTVNGPSFTVSNQGALYRQALAAAFDDARAKALKLAQSAGLSLGKAVAISENGASQPVFYAATAKAAGAADSTPVEVGQSEIQANVTVTFALA